MSCSDMHAQHNPCLPLQCLCINTTLGGHTSKTTACGHLASYNNDRRSLEKWHTTVLIHIASPQHTAQSALSIYRLQHSPHPAVAARHAAQCCNTSNHKSITNFVELSTAATANAAAQHSTAKQSHSCALQHSPSCACVHASDPYKPDGPAGAMPICPNTTCAHPAGALA
jgi:hypothetical protein